MPNDPAARRLHGAVDGPFGRRIDRLPWWNLALAVGRALRWIKTNFFAHSCCSTTFRTPCSALRAMAAAASLGFIKSNTPKTSLLFEMGHERRGDRRNLRHGPEASWAMAVPFRQSAARSVLRGRAAICVSGPDLLYIGRSCPVGMVGSWSDPMCAGTGRRGRLMIGCRRSARLRAFSLVLAGAGGAGRRRCSGRPCIRRAL